MANLAEESPPKMSVSTMGLLRNERFVDIICLVGPEKFPVKCHQLYLKAASPVFEAMLAERWQKQVNQRQNKNMAGSLSSSAETQEFDGNALLSSKRQKLTTEADLLEIQLPHVDQKTFQTFLLCIYEQGDASQHFKDLSHTEVINVLYFAHRFMLKTVGDECVNLLLNQIAVENVIEIHQVVSLLECNVLSDKTSSYILEHFSTIMTHASFSLVNKQFLLEFLPKDELNVNELELFQAILGWTASQCEKKKKNITKASLRHVLGDALYLIRFPTMTGAEFAKATCGVQVLTAEETVDIFKIICLGDPDNFKIDQKIALVAIGFLGPIGRDSEYEVTLRITGSVPGGTYLRVTNRVMAKRGEIFYLQLDKPIVLDATSTGLNGNTGYYFMKFMLKGPLTSSPIPGSQEETYTVSKDGVDFIFSSIKSPMASLVFNKL